MINNQLIGLRHFVWSITATANLVLLWALFALWPTFLSSKGLAEFSVLPYMIAVSAAFLHMGSLIGRNLNRLVPAGLVNDFFTVFRMMAYQAIAFAVIYVLLKDVGASRLFLGVFLVATMPLNFFLIRATPRLYERIVYGKKRRKRAVVVGYGPLSQQLENYVNTCRNFGINFVGIYGDETSESLGLPLLGKVSAAEDALDDTLSHVEHVLVFSNNLSAPDLRRVIRSCLAKGIRVQAFSNIANSFEEPINLTVDGSVNLISFVDEPLLNPFNTITKRIIDVAISLPVVIFLLPVLTLLVWLVQRRQSPGPLMFRQNRYGQNREVFKILKFRTMHVSEQSTEPRQASAQDSRVYPFGRFLRKTSLDEFPQFLNVLRGEMSLVGPRPHLTVHDEEFEKHVLLYRSRHFVKPGITGYAQIHGLRGEILDPAQLRERIQKDIYYVTNWSVQLEIAIVLRTIKHVLFPPKTAY